MKYLLVFASLVVGIWFLFPEVDYFPSQNSAYHAALVREYVQKNQQHFEYYLPTSSLSEFFPDQHAGYHFILAPWLNQSDSPWQILKIFQVLALALLGVYLSYLYSYQKYGLLFLVPIVLLLISNYPARRLYFFRPEAWMYLSMVVTSYSYIKSDYRRKTGIWLINFILATLFSWVNLILLVLPLIKKQSWIHKVKDIILAFAGFMTVLIFRGPVESWFQHFWNIFQPNVLGNSKISEWSQPNIFQPLFLFCLVLIGISFFIYKKFNQRSADLTHKLTLFMSVLFLILSIKYMRFQTGLYIWMGLLFIETIRKTYFKIDFTSKAANIVLTLLLFIPVTLKAYQLNQKGSFKNRSEVVDLRQFKKWSSAQNFEFQKAIVLRWENWSEFTWYFPSSVVEPGFAESAYKLKSARALNCLRQMRNSNLEIKSSDEFQCLDLIQKEFKSNLLFTPFNINYLKNINLQPQYFERIYSDSQIILVRLKNQSQSDKKISLAYDFLPANYFLVDNQLLSIATDTSKKGLSTTIVRQIYSLWVFCKNNLLSTPTCQKMSDQYYTQIQQQKSSAAHALLGLTFQALNYKTEIQQKIFFELISFIQSDGSFKNINYKKRDKLFYPGEMLTFMLSYIQANKIQNTESQNKIALAIRRYTYDYMMTAEPLMVRWLIEVAQRYNVTYKDNQFLPLLKTIQSHIEKSISYYCRPHFIKDEFVFMPSLWFEGISQVPDYIYSNKFKFEIFSCALSSLQEVSFESDTRKKYVFFPISYQANSIRIDQQAHGLAGYYNYLNSYWIE